MNIEQSARPLGLPASTRPMKHLLTILVPWLIATLVSASGHAAEPPPPLLKGWRHPPVIFNPGEHYGPAARNYQGIPGIERAPGGRLWATWYAGKVWEERFNYVVLATSGDDGATWSDAVAVIDPDGAGPLRAADSCLWLDPDGKLWCFWWLNEKVWSGYDDSKLSVTMAITTANPDAERPQWSAPFPLFSGLMLNKPIVTSQGEWMMPSNKWYTDHGLRVMVSTDKGRNWVLRGTANVPAAQRNADEPMIVERKDGSFWMLVRTKHGIGQTVSHDQGRTWAEVSDYQEHTVSRFHLRKLQSGNLLLIRHGRIDEKGERERLTAYLSEDDGRSWLGGLLLDERRRTSYPDATQAPDGTIHVVYDYNRHLEKQILMATFTERDVREGKLASPQSRSRVLVNRATGDNPVVGRIAEGPPLRTDESAATLITGGPRPVLRCHAGEVRPLHRTDDVFSDRDYIFRAFPGERFFQRDRSFVFAPMGRTEITCIEGGMVYVFTPAADRNPESVEPELLAQGFRKTSVTEFDLIFKLTEKVRGRNSCSVFQKRLSPGEKVRFGKWGVLVF